MGCGRGEAGEALEEDGVLAVLHILPAHHPAPLRIFRRKIQQ